MDLSLLDLARRNQTSIMYVLLVALGVAAYWMMYSRPTPTPPEAYADTMSIKGLEQYLVTRKAVVRRVWVSIKPGVGLDVVIEQGRNRVKTVMVPDPALSQDDVKELQARVDLPVTLVV